MPLPQSLPAPDGFFDAFTESLSDQLVEALLTSCDNAVETHDESFGSNATTFGFTLYHYATFRIAQVAADNDNMIVRSRNPLFRVLVGDRFELGCYKVGESSADSIWTSFPNNDAGAATMVQRYLPGLEPNISGARKVVLAYTANPEDGLGSAYLCIATRESEGKISEWGLAHEIYSPATERANFARTSIRHPEETITEAEIVRRKPNVRKQDDAGK